MLDPASAQAHLNLGIALVDQFDRPAGLKEFSEAARMDPRLAAAHYNLGRFFFETGRYEDRIGNSKPQFVCSRITPVRSTSSLSRQSRKIRLSDPRCSCRK